MSYIASGPAVQQRIHKDRSHLPVTDRIRLAQHTPEEIQAAREAVPLYRAAREAEKGTGPGGRTRYQGRSADALVRSRVRGEKRVRLVLQLVVAMAHEETNGT